MSDEYELWDEVARYRARSERIPPLLGARIYRSLRESGDHDSALECRTLLHLTAAYGDDEARAVLHELADDEWWSTPPSFLQWFIPPPERDDE